jgi:peptidoglycan/LPS O-acetylase OafA/YrhL
MEDTGELKAREGNNFGFLRLLFAVLVIASHAPELVDGNRSREILTRVFGTLSLGEVAVDGFFLISGYLILQSLMNSKSYAEYLLKRVLRIYPGYCASFLVSLCMASLAGGRFTGPGEALLDVTRALSLHTPQLDGAFAGNPLAMVNGAMWTVSYEFRCYLLIMLLGAGGLLASRRAYLCVTLVILACVIGQVDFQWPPAAVALLGQARTSAHFCCAFLTGGSFYLFRDRIKLTRAAAIGASMALVPLMFFPRTAEPALILFGGYGLFYFAFKAGSRRLNQVGSKVDLSYGIYLYAWPIQSLIIWNFRNVSPGLLFVVSALSAAACAYASWTLVEKPALDLKKRFFAHPTKLLGPIATVEVGPVGKR